MPTYELIVKVFDDAQAGAVSLQHLRIAEKEGKFALFDLAAVGRDHQGLPRVIESRDVSAPGGMLVGALAGALIGLLGGPAGAVAGAIAGAMTGGAVADRLDLGFSNAFLAEIQKGLDPEHSLVMILTEASHADAAVAELEQFPGLLLREVVKDQLLERLKDLSSNS